MTIPNPTAVVNAALNYGGQGWRVLPVHSTCAGRCTCNRACETPGKHPRLARWPELATVDPQVIRRWWSWWPTANVGVATGGGLLVLDVDGEAGAESLRVLEQAHGGLDTPRSITGRGAHYFFRTETSVKNATGIRPGLDIRAGGGFIVAPPSQHASGRRYAWDIAAHPDDVPVAPAPTWLLDLIGTSTRRSPAGGAELHLGAGERNDGLFREACAWRRRGVGQAALLDMLRVLNVHHVHPPLPDRELAMIAASAAKYDPADTDDGRVDALLLRALRVTG